MALRTTGSLTMARAESSIAQELLVPIWPIAMAARALHDVLSRLKRSDT
jgi:hypothetical protein